MILRATTRELESQRTPWKEQWLAVELQVERTADGSEREALKRRRVDLSENDETASFEEDKKRRKKLHLMKIEDENIS